MDYLLDTNICIDLINRRAAWWQRLADRITAVKRARVLLSALTVAELRYGVAKSPSPDKNRLALDTFLVDFEVVAFDSPAAQAYGEIRATLEKKGTPIGALDTLLAAHAQSIGATFVTHNTREFGRVPGLKLVDWTRPAPT
jgi:tRNA(fMet)-specific endonuclease VapC